MARTKNKIEISQIITEALNKITNEYVIEEALLYGSYAKGAPHEWSDIDIALVSNDFDKTKSICFNNIELTKRTKLFDPDLQLMSFPSETFYKEDFVDPNFIREIKRTGKRVYTKESGIDLSTL